MRAHVGRACGEAGGMDLAAAHKTTHGFLVPTRWQAPDEGDIEREASAGTGEFALDPLMHRVSVTNDYTAEDLSRCVWSSPPRCVRGHDRGGTVGVCYAAPWAHMGPGGDP